MHFPFRNDLRNSWRIQSRSSSALSSAKTNCSGKDNSRQATTIAPQQPGGFGCQVLRIKRVLHHACYGIPSSHTKVPPSHRKRDFELRMRPLSRRDRARIAPRQARAAPTERRALGPADDGSSVSLKVGSCLCCVSSGRGEYAPIGEGAKVPPPPKRLPTKFVTSKSTPDVKRSGKVSVKHTKHVIVSRDASGAKKINQYLVCKTLDSGASGKVKLVLDTNTQDYYVCS